MITPAILFKLFLRPTFTSHNEWARNASLNKLEMNQ
jgi:hypothetical protein